MKQDWSCNLCNGEGKLPDPLGPELTEWQDARICPACDGTGARLAGSSLNHTTYIAAGRRLYLKHGESIFQVGYGNRLQKFNLGGRIIKAMFPHDGLLWLVLEDPKKIKPIRVGWLGTEKFHPCDATELHASNDS